MRGLVLAASKLLPTTALFVLLVFFSENKGLATGTCGALLTIAAACSARAGGDGGSSDGGQSSNGSGGGGSGGGVQKGDGEDEQAELLERR